jgi:hypothetical protein
MAQVSPPAAPAHDPFLWPNACNPFSGNPLKTRNDVEAALRSLVAPMQQYRSAGGARIRLDAASAHFDRAAADFEAFARPLWGLAPAAAGGATWIDWEPIRRGLANGTNPDHPEYWGPVGPKDQRMVELAAIGFAMRLVPEHIWAPLDASAQRNLAKYLLDARVLPFAENNWRFFRLMIDLGLGAVGIEFDPAPSASYLADLESYYLDDGWYRDGIVRRVDYYIPFAMQFYGLLLAAYGGDPALSERFRSRAQAFAPQFARWFSDDGAALAFGRSMTYRFAMGGFWGALAVADLEALPWGEVKGYYLRHLRWWSTLPIAHRDGILSIGYGYPNLLMSENYNSAGSPYWALKAFVPLALPPEHPFWQAEEKLAPKHVAPAVQPQPGMVLINPPQDAIALSSGQQNMQMRFGPEKYSKFAYSARYAFSVESDERCFELAALDNTLGMSDDGRHFRVRETNEEVRIAGTVLWARWKPWADVEVETWLWPVGLGHQRIHRIRTSRRLSVTEGGFAIARTDGTRDLITETGQGALIESDQDIGFIQDLGSSVFRQARAHRAPPNTNLISARTWVPQLLCVVEPGEVLLTTHVVATADRSAGRAAWDAIPPAPDVASLETLIKACGMPVGAMSGVDDQQT